MNRAFSQIVDDSRVAEADIFHCVIVRKHRDHNISIASTCHRRSLSRSLFDQRLRLLQRSVVNRNFVTGIEQVRRHSHSHVSQSNESDFHDCSYSPAKLYASALRSIWKKQIIVNAHLTFYVWYYILLAAAPARAHPTSDGAAGAKLQLSCELSSCAHAGEKRGWERHLWFAGERLHHRRRWHSTKGLPQRHRRRRAYIA